MIATALRALQSAIFVCLVFSLAACDPGSATDAIHDANEAGRSGTVRVNGPVRAMVSDGRENLYAAGEFITAEGVTGNHVARWDGAAWRALGRGMDRPVLALAVDQAGNLYAGGEFTSAGGVSASHVARWDGSAWSPLGTGTDGPVYALALDGGDLYAGGQYSVAGAVTAKNIARWDGAAWSPLGAGVSTASGGGAVRALAIDSDHNVFAGGQFTMAGDVALDGVARWDGSNWSAMGHHANWIASALALDANQTLYLGGYAAGQILVAKWDGAEWAVIAFEPIHFDVAALHFDGLGRLYAGGRFTRIGGVEANSVARWDGSTWSALGSGTDGPVSALLVDSGRGTLYAGGEFTQAFGQVSPYFVQKQLDMIVYDGNGQTGGSAPVDDTPYKIGDAVTVLGQGTLTRTHYTFTGWNTQADGSGTQHVPGEGFTFAGAYLTLYAQWARNGYAVTATGTNGTVTPASQTVVAEGTATLLLKPDEGYADWSGSTSCGVPFVMGDLVSANERLVTLSPITFDCAVNITFVPKQYWVRLQSSGARGVSFTPMDNQLVTLGNTATFTTGSTTYMTGCGGRHSGNIFTTAPVVADCLIFVTYAEPFTVSATAGSGGSISPAMQTIYTGRSATLTLTPSAGYSVASVSGCGGTLTGNIYTTGPIDADCSVTAAFTAF